MNTWKDPNKELPKYDKEIYYISENDREGYAYLSARSKKFLCKMISDPIVSKIVKWRYIE